jgi:hypothetical protein
VPNTVRILRSTTAGATPSSLVSGQIAVNEADGKLFYRATNGTVTQFASGGGSSLASYSSASGFPGTGSASVLYLDQSRSRLYRWVAADNVYAEIGTIGGIEDSMDGGTYA